ncbi:MAG TPA: NAD(P)H-dependent oxidoreductase [Streptosporangiaceae bacterium]|nr:NAD(P)H-dependent oxidoreductase [Streptosporangiaceae bacterium]
METKLPGRQSEAQRNAERVLTAARAVFGELGAEAPVSVIAERAGVGIGTLYRHFPTKENLIRQLCVATMERTTEEAAGALTAPDAWLGFTTFVGDCVRQGVGTMAHLAGHYEVTEDVWEIASRLNTAIQAVIDRAHRDGPLRPGVTSSDLTEIFRLLGAASQNDRFVALALDGLCGAEPLPGRGATWAASSERWRHAPGGARIQTGVPAGPPARGDDVPLKVGLIIGSVRDGRFGPTVASWIAGEVERHNVFEIDVIDLAETGLPHRQQPPAMNGRHATASVRAYAGRIAAADAFIMVTPEYNHGYPAALKLALDSVYPEWRGKPVGFASYGGVSGGLRAVEQLRLVVAELGMVSIRNTVSFAMARQAFGPDGAPLDPAAASAAHQMLRELTWWARSLRTGRAAHPLA